MDNRHLLEPPPAAETMPLPVLADEQPPAEGPRHARSTRKPRGQHRDLLIVAAAALGFGGLLWFFGTGLLRASDVKEPPAPQPNPTVTVTVQAEPKPAVTVRRTTTVTRTVEVAGPTVTTTVQVEPEPPTEPTPELSTSEPEPEPSAQEETDAPAAPDAP